MHTALIAAVFSGAFFVASAGDVAPTAQTAVINKQSPITVQLTKQTQQTAQAGQPKQQPSARLAQAATTAPVATPAPTTTIRVAAGDTLSKLALQHSTTYQRLFYANNSIENPNLIFPGQELRVPAADEQLAARPLPEDAPVAVKAEVQAEARTAVEAPAPATAPVQRPVASSAPAVADGSVWDRLAQCEAGGNWAINTGNGFYGSLQFTVSSWQAAGGSGYPHQASREEQIMRSEKLLAMQGWGACQPAPASLAFAKAKRSIH